jgi:hypothetical protein
MNIFGKKKIDRIGQRQDAIIAEIENLKKEVNAINQENHLAHGVLADNFNKLIAELKKIQQVTEIPLVKPIIRDAERAMKKEKKESEAINMWKN